MRAMCKLVFFATSEAAANHLPDHDGPPVSGLWRLRGGLRGSVKGSYIRNPGPETFAFKAQNTDKNIQKTSKDTRKHDNTQNWSRTTCQFRDFDFPNYSQVFLIDGRGASGARCAFVRLAHLKAESYRSWAPTSFWFMQFLQPFLVWTEAAFSERMLNVPLKRCTRSEFWRKSKFASCEFPLCSFSIAFLCVALYITYHYIILLLWCCLQ